jgi:L-lactate dehydrogenase complex protein LldG
VSTSASSRDAILTAVRTAIRRGVLESDVTREYAGVGADRCANLVDLLVERLVDYRANVVVTDEASVAARIGEILTAVKAARILTAPGLPKEWAPAGFTLIEDAPILTARDLDEIGHVITGCALAIARLGSLVFDHRSDGQGRRAITLVPDHHICIVREIQIVAALPDAIAHLHGSIAAGLPVTFVSGPSATSDIELRRVEGVHGPRRLDVVVVLGPEGGK